MQESEFLTMTHHHRNDRLSMTGHVQGFELPRGCLMTSGVILAVILTFAVGLARASSLQDVMLAIAVPMVIIFAAILVGRASSLGRG